MKRKLSPFKKLGGIIAAAMVLNVAALAADIEWPGLVKVENFDNVAGDPVENLLAAPKYINNQPDSIEFINSLIWLRNPSADNYGSRITGLLTPPETGDYVFYIASDNNSWLYLSTDSSPANLKLIAADQGWQDTREWTGPGGVDNTQNPPWRRGNRLTGEGPFENRSDQFYTSPLSNLVTAATRWPKTNASGNAVITLTNGVKYYFQYLFKEGGGGDNAGVAWRKPSDTEDPANDSPEIGTEFISMIYSDVMSFKTQPTNQTRLQGQLVNIVGEANAYPGGITYQWYDNGVAIDGATSSTYSIPSVTIAEHSGHKYKVVVTSDADPTKTITSTEITLTVNQDNVAPTVLRIRTGEDLKTVRVYFSEPMDDSALTVANYVFNPALTVDDAIWDKDLHEEANILPVIGDLFPRVADDPRHRQSVILFVTGITTNTTYSLAINNVKDLAGNALTPNTKPVNSPVLMTGVVNFKRWMGSGSVATLLGDPLRLGNPSTAGTRTIAETGSYSDNNNDYVARLSGYFVPPAGTNYVFYIAADNDGLFFLSTDADPANLHLVAADIGWQNAREWTGVGGASSGGGTDAVVFRRGQNPGPEVLATNNFQWVGPFENRTDQFLTSSRGALGSGIPATAYPTGWPTVDADGNQVITLVAGQRYYFELYQQEFDGGHVEVTYKIPATGAVTNTAGDPANGTASIVTGNVIAALVDPSSLLPTITTQPTNVNFTIGGNFSLVVAASSSLPVTYQWYRDGVAIAGATSATLTVNNAAASDLANYYAAVSNENGAVNSATVAAITAVPAPGLTFQEDNTGTTVIETEHYYAAVTAADGHLWARATSRADASGGAYMTLLPDSGVNLGTPANFSTVARLDLRVNFATTGTHYLWIRGGDPTAGGAGDSVHAGFDGASVAAGVQITGAPTFNTTTWAWVGLNSAGTRVAVDVPTAGIHTVNLFMREDGFLADKIILTTDSAFTPTGQGPAESAQFSSGPGISIARSGATVTITYQGTLVSSTTPNGTYTPVAGASGGTYVIPAGSPTTFFRSLQ